MSGKEFVIKNVEKMVEEKYYRCSEKVGIDILRNDINKYNELQSKLTAIFNECNLPKDKIDEIDSILGDIDDINSRNFFIQGAMEMLSEAYEKQEV